LPAGELPPVSSLNDPTATVIAIAANNSVTIPHTRACRVLPTMWYDFVHPSGPPQAVTILEEHHFMLRTTLWALALACAITCTAYGQQPSSQPAPQPPAAPAGQNAPMPGMQANPAPANPAPMATNVPMTEPVITLKGACEKKPGGTPPPGCVSSLTREQFEKLTNALQPADKGPVPPDVRRRFATQYAKLLTFANAARELGLQNDPRVQEIYHFAMNQILAENLNQHYTEEFAHPSDKQIQEYYDKNVKKYKEVTLQRIIVPVYQAQASADKDKPKPTEAEQKAYGEKIRERWVAGEDPTKLEKEIMEHNNVTTPPPDVNVGARREGSLPMAHASVFEMKPNEISQPFSDATAVYIYKVVSERQVPLTEVKASISQTLQQQMFKDKIQQVQDAVTPVLNDAYFGPEPPPSPPHNMMRPGGPPMPGAGAPGAPPPPPHTGPGAGMGAPGTPPANPAPSPQ